MPTQSVSASKMTASVQWKCPCAIPPWTNLLFITSTAHPLMLIMTISLNASSTWKLRSTLTTMKLPQSLLQVTSMPILAPLLVLEAQALPIVGELPSKFIDRNNLFVPSHSLVSTGPSYTFHSGGTFSTIDYILTNKASTDLLDKCKGIPDHPLNVSDHLPLSISLQVSSLKGKCTSPTPKIHWEKAVTTGAISAYEQYVNDFISPLLGSSCDDLAQLEQEVLSVSEAICKCAYSLLPKCSSNRRPRRDFYNDGHLKLLCNLSKSSWKEWKNGGRPQSGDLLVNKIAAKKKVQTRLNQLRAGKDRLHSEHIDDNFRARYNKRFRSPRDGTPSGSRLQVNNNIITCPDDVMSAWVTHFETLGSSKVQESPLLQQLQSSIPLLHSLSLNNEDYVLDVPITIEEIREP